MLKALDGVGAAGTVIGRFTPNEAGLVVRDGRGVRELPRFPRDELARFLSERDAG